MSTIDLVVKWDDREKKWVVYGKIPPETKNRRHARRKQKRKALERKSELEVEFHKKNSLVSDTDREMAEHAVRRLATQGSNLDAKGKSIDFAVDWFLTRYKDESAVKTVGEYVGDFLEKRDAMVKNGSLSEVTVTKDRDYLLPFRNLHGPRKLTEVTLKDLKDFCGSYATDIQPYKVVYGFFSWLSNSHTTMERVENPVYKGMGESPFFFYKRPTEKRTEILIAKRGEVEKILRLAHKKGVLPFFWFGFFLGIRPDVKGELVKFLTAEYGWNYIDLKRGTVTIPKEIEKTRKRSREIGLRSTDKKWLRYFMDNKIELEPVNLVEKRREVLRAVLDDKRAKHPDIMRHTLISHRCKVERLMHEICRECATSEQMIRDHYQRFVKDSDAKLYFRIGPDILG